MLVLFVGVLSLAFTFSSLEAAPRTNNTTVESTGGRKAIGTPAPKADSAVKQGPVMAPPPPAAQAPVKAAKSEEDIVNSTPAKKEPSNFRNLVAVEAGWGGIQGEEHPHDEGFSGKISNEFGWRLGSFQPGVALELGGDSRRLLGTSRDFDLSRNVGYGQVLLGSRFYMTTRSWLSAQGGLAFNAINRDGIAPQEFVGRLGGHFDVNPWLKDSFNVDFISARQIVVRNNLQFDLGPIYLGAIGEERLIYEHKALAPAMLELGGEVGMKVSQIDVHIGSMYSPTTDSFKIVFGADWELPIQED